MDTNTARTEEGNLPREWPNPSPDPDLVIISPYVDHIAYGVRQLSSMVRSRGFSTRLVFLPHLQPIQYLEYDFSRPYSETVLDQLAEPGTGSGMLDNESTDENPVLDEGETVRNAEPLDEMAFEGEDTDPDPQPTGQEDQPKRPGGDLKQNMPSGPLTDWKGEDLSDTTLDVIELIDNPQVEVIADTGDMVESPTRDLKPALRAQKAAAAEFGQSDERDEFKKNRDRAQTVQGKPSLDLLAQASEDDDPEEPNHRATVQGKPLLDPDEKKKAGLPADEDE